MRDPESNETQKLATLLELGQVLSGTLNLKHSLHRALEILEQRHGMFRSAVMLLHDSELHIHASNGITAEGQKARYRLGEGITGRVVESRKPVVVPQVSKEPLLLNRAASRKGLKEELTFICVPILEGRKTIGALGVDLVFKKDRDYDRIVKFLRVIASMIGQAVRVERLVEAETQRLVAENTHLREELRERYDFSNMVGSSGGMRQVYEQVAQVAGTNTSVLIRGESGTGKELIAHAIHYNSPRANKPFVKVSCAALPETLIESELFGHERGAFTGAIKERPGRFELAQGGTIFLDDIDDVPLSMQVKLLRVLQNRVVERLGGTRQIPVDVRVVTGSKRDLRQMVAEGKFRDDLFYRLNVIPVNLPPLRDRREDIPILVDHFVKRYFRQRGEEPRAVSPAVMQAFMRYPWPGNVRELENACERIAQTCTCDTVRLGCVPVSVLFHKYAEDHQPVIENHAHPSAVSLDERLREVESNLITWALKVSGGNKSKAAELLSIKRSTLGDRIKKLELTHLEATEQQ